MLYFLSIDDYKKKYLLKKKNIVNEHIKFQNRIKRYRLRMKL
jgi:hypothetical protein